MSDAGNGDGGLVQLTAKDFKSDQEVRWCPGCGDYAILNVMQGFMPELGLAPRGHRLHLRHRLCRALPVLHADVRDALDPRARTGDRHRAGGDAAGSLGLGRDRRRGCALDRRQPPHPRAAPQRPPQDPALQQPHLRADQGPVLTDLRAREGDQVDADGVDRPSLPSHSRSPSAPRRRSSRARSTRTRPA